MAVHAPSIDVRSENDRDQRPSTRESRSLPRHRPKAHVGDPAYDPWSLVAQLGWPFRLPDATRVVLERIRRLAGRLDLPPERIAAWGAARDFPRRPVGGVGGKRCPRSEMGSLGDNHRADVELIATGPFRGWPLTPLKPSFVRRHCPRYWTETG
jgi:hypothetical protein